MQIKRRSISTRLYELDNTQSTLKITGKVILGESKNTCSVTVTQFNIAGDPMNIYGFRSPLNDRNEFKILTKTLRKRLRKWGLQISQIAITDAIKELSKLSY